MMKRSIALAVAVSVPVFLSLLAVAWSGASDEKAEAAPDKDMIARGRYLVDRVGMCSDCHTPRLPDGKLDMSRYLQGALVDMKPVHPVPGFAELAPDITGVGLKDLTVAEVLKILQSKIDPEGRPIPTKAPPMPPYSMNDRDALAVVTYLKSIQPVPGTPEKTDPAP